MIALQLFAIIYALIFIPDSISASTEDRNTNLTSTAGHSSLIIWCRGEYAVVTRRHNNNSSITCNLDISGALVIQIDDAGTDALDDYICEDANGHQLFSTTAANRVFVEHKTGANDDQSQFNISSFLNTRDNCNALKWSSTNKSVTIGGQFWRKKNGDLIVCSSDEVISRCNESSAILLEHKMDKNSNDNDDDQNNKNNEAKSGFRQFLAPLITILMALFVIIIVIVGFVFLSRKRSEIDDLMKLHSELLSAPDDDMTIDPNKPLREQVDLLPFDRSFEIRLHRITIRKVLSKGRYGRVYAATLYPKIVGNETMDVHVKGPKEAAKYDDARALADEAKVMMAIGLHPNILCLIGVVIENMERGGDLYVVVEHTVLNLKGFLHKRKECFINELMNSSDNNAENDHEKLRKKISNSKREKMQKTLGPSITTSLLCSFAYQIANAMEFLASKNCVHRDLAARNVLLKSNRIIRIADFGEDRQWDYKYLMQSIEYASPFKIMARESISESRFSEKTDVWSYGILLWEIFTLGDDPHKGFYSPQKLAEFYQQGGRLNKPPYMPPNVSTLMFDCWQEDPNMRPNFVKCKNLTQNILGHRNPQLLLWLQNQLKDELVEMGKYSEWRDGNTPERSISSEKNKRINKA